MTTKKFLSTAEAAKLLGISRVAVFQKIKSGRIKAQKIGRNFAIRRQDLLGVLGAVVGEKQKQIIDRAVQKAVQEYGETFRLLGQE